MPGTAATVGKRMFDIVVAGAALLLLWPLLLALALWVRLDSPGPALFRQERVGLGGVLFRIHKFRTMRSAARDDATGRSITVGDDPRVTRAGAILRRSKLDELPQLFDVLRGEMSLVGPRPEVPEYVAHYPQSLKAKVLSVRPGITDLASIEYRHESERLAAAADPEREYREVILPAKLALAARYVDRAGVGFDLVIIGRTLKALLTSR